MSKSLARNGLLNVLYHAFSLVFPLIYASYVARILNADGIGRVGFASNIVSYFLLLASFGISVYGTREVPKVRDRKEDLDRLFTELAALNSLFTLLASAGFVLFLFLSCRLTEDFRLYLCCAIPLFLNFINIDWLYKGEEDYGYIVCRSLCIKCLMIAALFIFIRSPSDYIKYALISGLALAGNYVFNAVHARKYVSLSLSGIKPLRHLKPCLTFFIGDLLSVVYIRVDVLMLGLMCGSVFVGLYDYGHKIVNIAISVCIAFSAAFIPRLSYYHETDGKAFLDLIDLGIKILIFLTVPMAAGLVILASHLVLVLYGVDFSASVPVVRIFSVLIAVRGIGDLVCWQTLVAIGEERMRVLVASLAGIINVLLNALLIPRMDIRGAAVASVASEIAVNVILFVHVRRKVRFTVQLKSLIQALVSASLMAAVVLPCSLLMQNHIRALLTSFSLGVVTYSLVNIMLRNDVALLFVGKLRKGLRPGRTR